VVTGDTGRHFAVSQVAVLSEINGVIAQFVNLAALSFDFGSLEFKTRAMDWPISFEIDQIFYSFVSPTTKAR
jgi:hypothetical protein